MPRVAPDSNDTVVWKFDDAGAPFLNTGTTSGSNNLTTLSSNTHLGMTNPRLQAQGPFGEGSYAVDFAGSQGGPRAYIAGANDFQPQPPISISGWVYIYQYEASFTQHWFQKQHTIGVWSGSTFQTIWFQNRIYAGQAEQVDFGLYTAAPGGESNGTSTDITRRIHVGTWNHFGHTFDGNNTVFYLNGDVWATTTLGGAPRAIVYDATASSGPWFVGGIPSGSGAVEEPYCKLADWRIADVVRPKSYFENIYRQGRLSWTGVATELPAYSIPRTRYYKLRASCSSSPTGYIHWTNTTGDDTGQPACGGTLGPSIIIRTWEE